MNEAQHRPLSWMILCFLYVQRSASSCFIPLCHNSVNDRCPQSLFKSVGHCYNARAKVDYSSLFFSGRGSASDNDESDRMDELRRMLEASWNFETMGEVPRDSSTAAEAAVTALRQAMRDDSNSAATVGTYLIDLQFPPYDISQGENMYDEVAAAEFCIELARRLSMSNGEENADSKCLILVRDDQQVETITRVLNARQRNKVDMNEEEDEDEEEDEEDEKEFEEDKDDDDGYAKESVLESYDDFDGYGNIGGGKNDPSSLSPLETNDIDSFRQKLMSNWEQSSSMESPKPAKLERIQQATPKTEQEPIHQNNNNNNDNKKYRLASLFGSSPISKGADMGGDVLRALRENVQPRSDEQTLLVLSSSKNQPDEMIAIRTMILQEMKKRILDDDTENVDTQQKQQQRNFVLVNCQLDPWPRELMSAKTVYSLLPLIAKPVQQSKDFMFPQKNSAPQSQSSSPIIKVVVMRRYPRDWEVFVDDGSCGRFERASVSSSSSQPTRSNSQRPPSMSWISECVQKYLQSRLP